jgi:hypothetical protein
MEIYHRAPEPGQWKLVLDWQQPVTGDELQEPFTGSIQFNQVRVDGSDLPDSASTMLTAGITHYFHLTVENTGVAPEGFFADPRLDSYEEVTLANQNTSVDPSDFALPLPLSDAPFYFVPTHTTQLTGTITRLTGAAPVTFDMLWEVGDPEVSPVVPSPGTVASSSPSGATLTLGEADIAPGYWYVEPDEIGPYPAGGAPTDTASFGLQAITQAFDPTISSNTDDLWQDGVAFSNFLYLQPGQSGTISVDITPSSSGPRQVSGTLYTDDWVLSPFAPDDADELAATPYEYQVAAPGTSGRLRETKGTPGRGSYFKNPS